MMGGTSLCIKAKWVTLKSWLLPSSLILLHRQKRQHRKEQQRQQMNRRQQPYPSQDSHYLQEKQQQEQQHRRPSHCTSCSSRPSSELQEDDRQAYTFFKRRSSQSSQMTMTDLHREAEKIYDLFLLAMDELNYAGDSQGTFYYINDRVSAQEAIENFSCASMQLLTKTHDPQFKSQLQSMVRPRLSLLQKKFDELPDESAPLTHHHRSIYCS